MIRSVSATLIALAAFVLPVQAGTISTSDTFTGTVTSSAPSFLGGNVVETQTTSGTGDLLPLGSFTYTNSDDLTVYGSSFTTFAVTNGIFTDTFAGGTLFGRFTGSGTTNMVVALGTADLVITGGTGAYLGYTGTDTQDLTFTIATGAIAGTGIGSLTTTPLPSTWLMLLSGFLGLGFFAYRGINKSVVAVATA